MDILNTNISFLLSRLYRNEHVAAHEDMLVLIKPDVEQIPEVKKWLDEYEAGIERLNLIFKHSPESPETMKIAEFDGRRDELWLGGKRVIKLYLNSLDPAIRTAANGLRILVNTYGDVPHFSLYGETGSLRHAINDFNKQENQAKAALIPGLSAIIDELETVNNELYTRYMQRLQEAEAVKLLGKLADYLPIVDKQLIALFQALNTIYNYNEMTAKLPALKATIEHIAVNSDALFDQLKKVLERRGHKTGGGTQKPDITNPEVPGTDTPDPEEPGEGGGGGETPGGGTENPDIDNPPPPPFLPDFE